MRGSNELHFNQATMILAVQHYLEKIMHEPVPKVKHVKQDKSGSYAEVFIIDIVSEDEKE